MRISDLFRSKKIRSTSLVAVAALSWVMGSGIPEAVMTDGQGTVVSSGWVESAYAKDPERAAGAAAVKPAAADQSKDSATDALKAVNGIIEVVMMLFLPATILAGWLLSPDWTFGEIFGLRPIIHNLWVLISNVVYVIFAFLLIAMAFMNIFGQGGDHYAMKKALPRFITGILIVPFTWFAVSGILSVTNLLTASILRLPADMLDQTTTADGKKAEMSFTMPDTCTLNFDKLASGESQSVDKWKGDDGGSVTGKFFKCDDVTHELTFKEALASDTGAYGILNIYAYGIFRVQEFKKIDSVSIKGISSVVDMVINLGLWLIFLVVYALLVLALTFALFTRAFYLWLIAIFSPLFGLFYYLEGKGGFAEDLKKKLSFSVFISLAMVPVYVSAALGFGLLFIKMAEDTTIKTENSTFFNQGSESKPWDDSKFVIGPEGNKATTITVKGMPVGVSESAATAGAVGEGAVKLGASAIGRIIVGILAVVVLWMSVMAALNSSEITKSAVEPVMKFGTDMGKLMASAPKYIPLHTTKEGHKMTLSGLGQMAGGISQTIEGAATKWGREYGNQIGDRIAATMGMGMSEMSKALRDMTASKWSAWTSKQSQWQDFNELATKFGSLGALSQDKWARDILNRRIDTYSEIKDPAVKKLIHDKIESGTVADLTEAFKKIEEALWHEFVGWAGLFMTNADIDNWLKEISKTGNAPGAAQTTITPVVSQDKKSVVINNKTIQLAEAGKMKQTEFDKLAADAGIADKADLKKKLKDSGIEVA